MTIADWLMISAVLLGPILAVRAQKFIESRQERKNRRLYIFRALMATRGNPISAVHVEALNLIYIEFYGTNKKDKKVVEAWRTYFSHLCNAPGNASDPNYRTNYNIWLSKKGDLLIDLLYEMSKCLSYSFDRATLRDEIYVPQGHQDVEIEQNILRRGLIDVLLNGRAIPVDIKNLNPPAPRDSTSAVTERRLLHDQRN